MTYGYVCFYKGKRFEVTAENTYEAQKKAVSHFKVKPKQTHMVSVVLAEKNGEQVAHFPLL